MESVFTFTAADTSAAQSWAHAQLADWGVRGPHASAWVQQGARLLGADSTGTVVLCYDPAERLLSLDVWCEGARLFGMDDLL